MSRRRTSPRRIPCSVNQPAAAIARGLGAEVGPMPFEPVLRGWMWDGTGGTFLRADLRGGHDESPGASDADPLWWPVAKVAGRFLAPFLQGAPEPVLTDLKAGPEAPAGRGARGSAA